MAEFVCDDCGKELSTLKGLIGHKRLAHVRKSESKALDQANQSESHTLSEANNLAGEAMDEKEVEALFKKLRAEEKQAEERTKREESEKSSISEAIKGIGDRLDRIDEDVCKLFPELCQKVDKLEKAASGKKLEHGSEEWKSARKANLEHTLFQECPECSPVRDEVLAAKGKKLAYIEAEVSSEQAEEPELETSPGYKPGFKWDWERELYVKKAL